MSQAVQTLQTVSAVWGLGLGSLVVYVGSWIVDHSAHPRLEEAKKVVAEIDRTMANIPSATRDAMNEEDTRIFDGLQQQRENIHYDLNLLKERVLKADMKQMWNIWGNLVTELEAFIAKAKALEADTLTTTNRVVAQYRQATHAARYFVPATDAASDVQLLPLTDTRNIAASASVTAVHGYDTTNYDA